MMKALVLLVCTLALACVVGCVSQKQATTQLRLGMTKSEVIQLMGRPNWVNAEENIECLVYIIAQETNHAVSYGDVNPGLITSTASLKLPYIVRFLDGVVVGYGINSQSFRPTP